MSSADSQSNERCVIWHRKTVPVVLILREAFYTFSVSPSPQDSAAFPTTGVEIVVETATRTKFRVKLLIDDDGIDLERQTGTTWVPQRSL